MDKICRKHNIKYSLNGGSMLGAIRHKGFIPWDDDADLEFTRQNFNKFEKVFNRESEKCKIDIFNHWVPCITSRSNTDIDSLNICTDIFIFDDISSNKLAQRMKNLSLRTLQGMMKDRINLQGKSLFNKIMLLATFCLGKLYDTSAERTTKTSAFESANI